MENRRKLESRTAVYSDPLVCKKLFLSNLTGKVKIVKFANGEKI